MWDDDSRPMVGDYLARGMHGGIIYIRSEVDPYLMGKEEVGQVEVTEKDRALLENLLGDYCKDFSEYGLGLQEILSHTFVKLFPVSSRPYGKVYAY